MIDSGSACPWGRENRVAFGNDRALRALSEGRRVKFRHKCLDEPEDARPAKVCSGIRGCGGLESVI